MNRAHNAALVLRSVVPEVLQIIGQPYAIDIIAFCGEKDSQSFEELILKLPISRATLTQRLKKLVAAGVLERRPVTVQSKRCHYFLSENGKGLFQLAQLIQTIDQQQILAMHCPACSAGLTPQNIRYRLPDQGFAGQFLPNSRHRGWPSQNVQLIATEHLSARMILSDRHFASLIALAFFGVKHFGDFLILAKLSSNILSDRLARLVAAGYLLHHQNYRLTEKALNLYPIIIGCVEWGDRVLRRGQNPSIILVHKSCEQEMMPNISYRAIQPLG